MVRINMKREQLIIFIVIAVAVVIGISLSFLRHKEPCPFECCVAEANYTDKECPTDYECIDRKCLLTMYNFDGLKFKFRADLREANNIEVYPSERSILNIIWNRNIENLTIVFVDSPDNSLVAINAFEITYKLKTVYLSLNRYVNITAKDVDSYTNLTASPKNPIIALMPPAFSNETLVKAQNYVIYIKGATAKDLDLATIKFIMSSLNITIG